MNDTSVDDSPMGAATTALNLQAGFDGRNRVGNDVCKNASNTAAMI